MGPAVARNALVSPRIPGGGPAFELQCAIPVWGLLRTLWHPASYPFAPATSAVIRVFDYLELASLCLAFGLVSTRRHQSRPGWLPLAMVPPRVCLQITLQVLAVIRGLL